MSPAATDLYVAVTYADGEGIERYACAMVPTDAPGVVMHDDWDALGMRASGSQSVSFEASSCQAVVRGGFRAGDSLPYGAQPGRAVPRRGLARHRASRPTSSPRRGLAGRINGDGRPRQVADNVLDLTPRARSYRARPGADRRAPRRQPGLRRQRKEIGALFAELQAAKAFVNEAAAQSSTERSRSRAGRLPERQPAGARVPRCQSRLVHAPAPTARTTTSAASLSAKRRRSTEMAFAAPASAAAAPDARSFRDALGRFATGVAFVTAAPDGEPAGLIVNSLTSVSLEPPLIAFCPSRRSLTWSRMRRAGRFGVNVLGRRHERFAIRATPPARSDS